MTNEQNNKIVRGQTFKLKHRGLVRFDCLDFYLGECTAKLTGIEYPGIYYERLENLKSEGIVLIDA
jgi:hypothetical protein